MTIDKNSSQTQSSKHTYRSMFFYQMEIKVLLVKLFQNYEFQLDSSETFELGQRVLMSPISGVKCTVTTRE